MRKVSYTTCMSALSPSQSPSLAGSESVRIGPASLQERKELELRVLIRFRWLAVFGLFALLATTKLWGGSSVMVANLVGVAAFVLVSNLWLGRQSHRSEFLRSAWIGWILVLDTFALTALLANSGGVLNPFSAFYLLQVVLAAMLAPTATTNISSSTPEPTAPPGALRCSTSRTQVPRLARSAALLERATL